MPETTIYTFLPPMLNKPVDGFLETGRTIRTNRIVILEESHATHAILGPCSGYFATTTSGSRYTLIVLPMSALQAWLADFLGIQLKEVTAT